MGWDWSRRSWPRVYGLAALGTLICIAFAVAFDSYSFAAGRWDWSIDHTNDVLIPLLIAPPFFFYLLSKLRQLAIAHEELLTTAATDGLTSLLNRRAFTAMVDGYLEHVAAEARGALLVVDVDYFKSVNDRFGHDNGDEALKLIANTIKGTVRDVDLVGRIGGEEFSVFLPGLDFEAIRNVAERIRLAVSEAGFAVAAQPYRLTVSIGGAAFADRADFSSLYRCADQWLYFAKEHGRDRVEVHQLGAHNIEPNAIAPSLH